MTEDDLDSNEGDDDVVDDLPMVRLFAFSSNSNNNSDCFGSGDMGRVLCSYRRFL